MLEKPTLCIYHILRRKSNPGEYSEFIVIAESETEALHTHPDYGFDAENAMMNERITKQGKWPVDPIFLDCVRIGEALPWEKKRIVCKVLASLE